MKDSYSDKLTSTQLESWVRICSICGKPFYIQTANLWTYKKKLGENKIQWFCSYTCKRTGEKLDDIEREEKKKRGEKCLENAGRCRNKARRKMNGY